MNSERARRCLPVILTAAFLLPGCLEQETTTTIHPDGTCERVIVIRDDGPAFPRGIFPIAVDSSWDTTGVRVRDSGNQYQWTLTKRFRSYDDLAREYAGVGDTGKIHVEVRVEKRFRWFYTYFEYGETYARYSRFNLIPPSAVLNEEEILRYTYGDTSRVLKEKVEEWEARNLFEVLYAPMVRRAGELRDTVLASTLASHKEEFFRLLETAEKRNSFADSLFARFVPNASRKDLFHDGQITEAGVDAVTELAVQVCGTGSLRELKGELRAGWKASEAVLFEELGPEEKGETFTNTVVMPGIVLETGAPEVKGSTVSWKFERNRLSLHDYEMRVESRTVNVWAIVVTGILVLGLLAVVFAVPMFSMRRNTALTPSA